MDVIGSDRRSGRHPACSVAGTLADAAAVAALMADVIRAADAAAGDDHATATRLLVARLLRLRPEDGDLLALLVWFATTHDVREALAALPKRG